LTVKVPVPTEILPSDKAPLLKRLTLFAPELLSKTLPVKLFVVFAKVNTPALPTKLAAPAPAACVMAVLAACVIPIPLTVKVPVPTEILPSDKAPLLKRLTLFAPELLSKTFPVKLFVVFAKVNTPALPTKLAAPALAACVIAVLAAWVIPIPLTVKVLLPTEILPRDKAPLLKRLTAFAPELLRATLPVKLLPVLAKVNTPALPVKLAAPAEAA